MWYVYHLIDPRSGAVFYVGKGQGERIAAHEMEARRDSEHPKCVRIRDIWAAGFDVIRHKAKTFKDEQEAYDFEADEIDRIGLQNLTNLAPGGGAPRQLIAKPSPEVSARMLCKCIARAAKMAAAGQRYSIDALNDVNDHLLTVIAKKLWLKLGAEFMKTELGKHGIKANFPDAPQQVQA